VAVDAGIQVGPKPVFRMIQQFKNVRLKIQNVQRDTQLLGRRLGWFNLKERASKREPFHLDPLIPQHTHGQHAVQTTR
jgi:hypothetical protein